jgi:hypothetical protein
MLKVVLDYDGFLLSSYELAEKAGVSQTGGSFATYTSKLRTAKLINDNDKSDVRLGEAFEMLP